MRNIRWLTAVPVLWVAMLPSALSGQGTVARLEAVAPPGYAGSEACLECHQEESEAFAETLKGDLFLKNPTSDIERLGCEGCHGPAAAHIESGGEDMAGMLSFGARSENPVSEQNALCLTCHESNARMMWPGSTHESRDVACADCHDVMRTVSERGSLGEPTVLETCASCHPQRRSQQARFSHMPQQEGRIECIDCHNPHGSANEILLTASSVNEVCYGCHAEKRGPLLWEHAPVTENCSNCHDPHGSNHEKMLNVAKARLCQQCHDETRHPTRPGRITDTRYWSGRQCANCHTMIHGSNHPSGFAFTR